MRPGLVNHDAVIAEVANHGQVQHAFLGMDVGDVRYPLALGPVCAEISVQKISVLVELLPHLSPLSATSILCQ